tara:strand:- start:247 stop:489 length:243 start_codon:yes stop_codon:yes gene_type:complete
MKISKFISDNASHLVFDLDKVIPVEIIRETIKSEIQAAQINSYTYWDHFMPDNIHRSNVLKAQIGRAQTEKNVSRRRVPS